MRDTAAWPWKRSSARLASLSLQLSQSAGVHRVAPRQEAEAAGAVAERLCNGATARAVPHTAARETLGSGSRASTLRHVSKSGCVQCWCKKQRANRFQQRQRRQTALPDPLLLPSTLPAAGCPAGNNSAVAKPASCPDQVVLVQFCVGESRCAATTGNTCYWVVFLVSLALPKGKRVS